MKKLLLLKKILLIFFILNYGSLTSSFGENEFPETFSTLDGGETDFNLISKYPDDARFYLFPDKS